MRPRPPRPTATSAPGPRALKLLSMGAPDDELVAVAAELWDARHSREGWRAQLLLTRHPSVRVRVAGAESMSASGSCACYRRLEHLAKHDRAPEVKAAAKASIESVHALPVYCIACRDTYARIELDDDAQAGDSTHVFPVFCSEACIRAYAMDAAAGALREGVHLCFPTMGYEYGDGSGCEHCRGDTEAGLLDDDLDTTMAEDLATASDVAMLRREPVSDVVTLVDHDVATWLAHAEQNDPPLSRRYVLEHAISRYLVLADQNPPLLRTGPKRGAQELVLPIQVDLAHTLNHLWPDPALRARHVGAALRRFFQRTLKKAPKP